MRTRQLLSILRLSASLVALLLAVSFSTPAFAGTSSSSEAGYTPINLTTNPGPAPTISGCDPATLQSYGWDPLTFAPCYNANGLSPWQWPSVPTPQLPANPVFGCSDGYLVFHFYGTNKSATPSLVTAYRVFQDHGSSNCGKSTVVFSVPTATDISSTAAPSNIFDRPASPEYPKLTATGINAGQAVYFSNATTSDVTTGPQDPLIPAKGGSCASYQNLAGASAARAAFAAVDQHIGSTDQHTFVLDYESYYDHETLLLGATNARDESMNLPAAWPNGEVTTDANFLSLAAKDYGTDLPSCTSAYQFAPTYPSGTDPASVTTPVMGECVIPLQRLNGVLIDAGSTLTTPRSNTNGGVRIAPNHPSSLGSAQPGTEWPKLSSSSATRSPATAAPFFSAWRSAIKSAMMKQPTAASPDAASPFYVGSAYTLNNGFTAPLGSTADRNLAASQAATAANCYSAVVNIPTLPSSLTVSITPASQTVHAGTPATFTVTVANTGPTPLTSVSVSSTAVPGCSHSFTDTLAANSKESAYTCTSDALRAGLTNVVVAHATDPENSSISAQDSATVSVIADAPGIKLTMTPTSQSVATGNRATFTLKVTNAGQSTLTNVYVKDPNTVECAKSFSGSLAAGASEPAYTCTSGALSQSYTNTAQASGTDPLGVVVTASNSSDVTVTTPPTTPTTTTPVTTPPNPTAEVEVLSAQLAAGGTINGGVQTITAYISNPQCPLCSTYPSIISVTRTSTTVDLQFEGTNGYGHTLTNGVAQWIEYGDYNQHISPSVSGSNYVVNETRTVGPGVTQLPFQFGFFTATAPNQHFVTTIKSATSTFTVLYMHPQTCSINVTVTNPDGSTTTKTETYSCPYEASVGD